LSQRRGRSLALDDGSQAPDVTIFNATVNHLNAIEYAYEADLDPFEVQRDSLGAKAKDIQK
jgi:hypothetical protein